MKTNRGSALVEVLQSTTHECANAMPSLCEQCPCTSGTAAPSPPPTTPPAAGKVPAGFARSYTLDGCADFASHCGEYVLVPAHCTSGDQCPDGSAANGNADPSMCDGAPVYQRAGATDGPVLYRFHYSDGGTRWWVGESAAALSTCNNGPGNKGFLAYADTRDGPDPPDATKQWYEISSAGWHRQSITITPGGGH